jgi:3-methyl-2-oxobutanoate hydroxymethyltransferase
MRQVPVHDPPGHDGARPAPPTPASTTPPQPARAFRTVDDFARSKRDGAKISMVTAYDAWSAALVARSSVDAILVGDSVAMVVHGEPTTLSATVDLMALHTRAVAKGAPDTFIVADMPFLSYRKGMAPAIDAVGALMTSGANAVKLEGVDGHEDIIRHIVESGVPVMGHLGLTPQSVHRLGGFRVQGRNEDAAALLLQQAVRLEALGCFAIVLECVPARVAADITSAVRIPTIGIGAGPDTDGQVLVLHDLLDLHAAPKARFVRSYFDGQERLTAALDAFDRDVKAIRFPTLDESYK